MDVLQHSTPSMYTTYVDSVLHRSLLVHLSLCFYVDLCIHFRFCLHLSLSFSFTLHLPLFLYISYYFLFSSTFPLPLSISLFKGLRGASVQERWFRGFHAWACFSIAERFCIFIGKTS